jgi:hypothetical protein
MGRLNSSPVYRSGARVHMALLDLALRLPPRGRALPLGAEQRHRVRAPPGSLGSLVVQLCCTVLHYQ